MLKDKANLKREVLLFSVFVFVNVLFFSLSMEGATVSEGADADQYYAPAIQLAEQGELRMSSGGKLLTSGTPLYSILLSAPIRLWGFDNVILPIVIFQCILLYITGFFGRKVLAQFYGKGGYMLHGLIIFNPNSLITAHLLQSETLFTFFLSVIIYSAIKLINGNRSKHAIILGLAAGLLTMTRPAGQFVLYSIPFIIAVSTILRIKINNIQDVYNFKAKRTAVNMVVYVLLSFLVLSPWYIRNYQNFGEFFLTSNSGSYIEDQYIQLLKVGRGWSESQAKQYASDRFVHRINSQEGDKQICIENKRLWKCSNDLSNSSLSGILDESVSSHAKALSYSLASLYFSGGASNIRNYLGIPGKEGINIFQRKEFNGLSSFRYIFQNSNIAYFVILAITTLFSLITRFLGIIGIFRLASRKNHIPILFFLLALLVIFSLIYLYLGQSRFRVPLEPILMMLATLGVVKNKS